MVDGVENETEKDGTKQVNDYINTELQNLFLFWSKVVTLDEAEYT